jgi:hypothetical protein
MISIDLSTLILTMTDDDSGDTWIFSGGKDVTVFEVPSYERQTVGKPLTPAPSSTVQANGSQSIGYTTFPPRYEIVLLFGIDGGDPLRFWLDDVSNQPLWTDDFAGAAVAVGAIKAAMIP